MDLQELRTLLDYHYWARDRVLDAAEQLTTDQLTRNLGSSFGSVRDTLAHTYAAEWAWCQRWQGESPASLLPSDLFPDIVTLRAKWAALESEVGVLDRTGRTAWIIATMISGDARQSVFWHMQHVVNHASYHRGG